MNSFWNSFLSFWPEAVTAIVAVLALFRPEIGKLFRRWTNKLSVFPTARLEVGFAEFGPTIGLFGSMVAESNDQLILDMNVIVTRERDNATHVFSWGVFRSPNLAQTLDKAEFHAASAFTIKQNEAKLLNVQFHDTNTRDRYRDILLGYQEQFFQFAQQHKLSLVPKPEVQSETRKQFESANPNATSTAWARIKDEFYWEAGKYRCRLSVRTSNPEKEFKYEWMFSLSEREVDSLRPNIISLMDSARGALQTPYNFVFPLIQNYKSPSKP